MEHDMYNAGRLMLVAFSNCTGVRIRELMINAPMRTTWNTGAFATVKLCCGDGSPQSLTVGAQVDPYCFCDYNMRFVAYCSMPNNSGVHAPLAVNLNLHDSYGGLWTTLSIICPPQISDKIDWRLVALTDSCNGEGRRNEHIVYSEDTRKDCCGITLVEDLSRCRKVVSHVCRELTSQLNSLGCRLRPCANIKWESVCGGDGTAMITGFNRDEVVGDVVIPVWLKGCRVARIGDEALQLCEGMHSVTILDGVTHIGACAFFHCANLKSAIIPDGVTRIRRATFYYCYSLTDVTIPDSVAVIEEAAFGSCSSLMSVTIPSNARVEKGAFDGNVTVNRR